MIILGINSAFNAMCHDPSAALMINGKVVSALEEERLNREKFTKKLIEPLIGLIINLPNLDNLGLFGDVDPNSGLQSGSFGAFLGEIINYLIIAFVMFLVIKAYNHFEDMVDDEENENVIATESEEVTLLKEIRDGINNLQTK